MKFLSAFLFIFLIGACDMVERENTTTSPEELLRIPPIPMRIQYNQLS